MSFLLWCLDVIRPLRQSDPVFGAMLHLRQVRYWEATTRFAPTGRDVELCIQAPRSGPSAAQRAFFGELQRRYPQLLPDLIAAVRAKAQDYDGELHYPGDIPSSSGLQVELVYIEVPASPGETAGWRFEFSTLPPGPVDFTVGMRGWKVESVEIYH